MNKSRPIALTTFFTARLRKRSLSSTSTSSSWVLAPSSVPWSNCNKLPVGTYSYTVVGIGVSFGYNNTGQDFQPRSAYHKSAAQNSVRTLVLTANEGEMPDRSLFVTPSFWHKAPFRPEHEMPSETCDFMRRSVLI